MSEAYDEFYINLIKKAERKAIICGEGNSKTGYSLKGHVILKTRKEPFKPAEYIKKLTALKNYGVNIALPKFFTSQDKVEKEGNRLIYYEVQEEAKGSFVSVSRKESLYSHIIAFNPSLRKQLIIEEKLAKEYNIEMAKHRAKPHLPQLSNFVFDYLTLCAFGNGDMHSENVFYSSKDGYTFFDLSPYINIDSNEDLNSQLRNATTKDHTVDAFSTLQMFMKYCYAVKTFQSNFINRKKHFEQFVYNGILSYQLIDALKANTSENTYYNPFFPNAKDFAEKIEKNEWFFREELFALDPVTLQQLEKGLINNDVELLNQIRTKYELGENFDFSCIDIPNFLETMKITHEFDFSNPAKNQTPTSLNVDHIKVSAIDENNFDFEMV